ncbi:MAG TPA: GGDEF domain-containing protein [Pyrinomonadaceae bacterium]|nr:GGDEF domain-containing protein [Pyrinomonadaceae bacterium]
MQVLPRTSRTGQMDLQRLVKQGTSEISQHWLEAMRGDESSPATERVKEPLLLDSLPLVLDEILYFVESDDSQIDLAKICRAVTRNRSQAREEFDVRELVRESQVLRESIFLYLHEHVAQFARRDRGGMTIYRRAGIAMDQAMRETINAFVEDHTGQLRHLSRTDSLTGLYNHRTFYERLDEELKRAKRYQSPLSIVLIDLDNFKSVNDTNGHQFGDYLLVRCAEWLHGELRETDIICRYGGDEFGIILPETTGEEALVMMARVAAAFRKFGAQEGAPASFGLSFGLAAHPEDDGTVIRMVKVADERLLLNKHESTAFLHPVTAKT